MLWNFRTHSFITHESDMQEENEQEAYFVKFKDSNPWWNVRKVIKLQEYSNSTIVIKK
jgi:DNA polymerase IIIc chi subunit